jgi:cell division protein FtsQ
MTPSATLTGSPPVSDATVHLQLRRRRRRRAVLARVLAGLVVVALLAGIVWLVGFSTVLAADRVAVTGEKVLTDAEVVDIAQVRLGEPLARSDVEAVAQRVATLPAVESVEVSRDWPHTVHVAVVERTPVLAVKEVTGYQLIDRFGVAYRSVEAVPAGVALAKVDQANGPLLLQVGQVIQALPDSLARQVRTIGAETPDSITLTLADDDTILWGSAEQSETKAAVIAALRKVKGSVYDVSAPGNPAVR